jgi:hypothetical protein
MHPEFSSTFRQRAAHYARLIDDQILPVIVQAAQAHASQLDSEQDEAMAQGVWSSRII